MTPDEIIAVVTAFKEGKTIEYANKELPDYWCKASTPIWDFDTFNYRVKPKPAPKQPREWWVNVYDCGQAMHNTKEGADRSGGGDRLECVHVREVLPTPSPALPPQQ